MTTQSDTIKDIDNRGAERGASFSFPQEIFDFLGNVDEVHMAEIVPGAVRGNHYHRSKKEVLVIWYAWYVA